MALPEIQISGDGMEITDAISDYINEKIKKYERIFDLATSIKVECTENVAARGVDRDFRVEILMNLPKAPARVEKSGADVYALVDEATDVLVRKVKRYKDKLRHWEGKASWKEVAAEEAAMEKETKPTDNFYNYIPKISKRKTLEDLTPISEEEAIERMEMLGYNSLLFKNSETGKYSMVYRYGINKYGLVEPKD